MKWKVPTNYESLTLQIVIATEKPIVIQIMCESADIRNCKYTNRYKTVTGTQSLFIRMPLTTKNAVLEVYNKAVGNTETDNSFKVISITKNPLHRKIDFIDITDFRLKDFVSFAQKFCINAGELEPNIYVSENGKFKVQYDKTITDRTGTKELNTPARVNAVTGVIEISRVKFIPMTYPMRLAILLHEYAHLNMNENADDESEADLNALNVYLSLGYPRIEAHEAFLSTFENVATKTNAKRYALIKNFIEDFEKNNIQFK
ncbi:MAG: hypothetical protein RLY43_934 [Bacteroidota bacterium]